MFSRILIANRGEIALRIIRAARELGVEAVVVYSEADRDAPYVKLADRAVCIGPGPAAQSYLNIPAIIAAAEVANVDAIHPGYGFLAENAHFAEVCRSCEIEFIGPSVESMQLLGDKIECKKLAVKAKVPTFPGSKGEVTEEEKAVEIAHDIGYPVIIKAAAGGGGRGMRVAHNDITLRSGFHSAKKEAEAAFGNGAVFIEKFLEKAHHVEVQTIADTHGNAIHLYERDCTMQRRHQKLIEEAPCPIITKEQREALCKGAVRLVKAAGYYSAGTVEYLYDPKDKKFYLLEVNTRVQVEHPVTEAAVGKGVAAQDRRPRHRVPHQRRRHHQQLHPPARQARDLRHARRARRAPRYPLPPGLPRAAELRLDDRQAHLPRRRPRPGHRPLAARPARVRDRPHPDHHPAAPAPAQQLQVCERRRRHQLR
jgi:acetyl-CoA carboxylase biotin carboxylase subunit